MIALKLFGSKAGDAASAAGEKAALDFQDVAITILLKFIDVLEGVAVIIAGIFLVKFLKIYFARIEVTHERQRTALNLMEKITSGFFIVIAITLGLKIMGLDLTLLVSVLTLGVSFGMRDVIKNYVAGLLILFKSPFEIGDVVKIRSYTGKIEKIEFQAVTLRTFDQKEITIHNRDLLTQPLTNFSRTQQVRLEINLSLGYGSDFQRALKIFDKILRNHPAVLKMPKYSIVFKEFFNQGIGVLIRFWAQKPCNPLRLRSELALQIQEAFDEENLLAPYAREAGLAAAFGMTAARQERLKAFYGQPILADIAGTTAAQAALAAAPVAAVEGAVTEGGAPAPVEEYADAEEPE